MKTGIELIAAERERQIIAEGWSAAHDDEHGALVLAMAASCYATPPAYRKGRGGLNNPPTIWPFENESWKPTPRDQKRELVKAGALIAAALDCIERREALDSQNR